MKKTILFLSVSLFIISCINEKPKKTTVLDNLTKELKADYIEESTTWTTSTETGKEKILEYKVFNSKIENICSEEVGKEASSFFLEKLWDNIKNIDTSFTSVYVTFTSVICEGKITYETYEIFASRAGKFYQNKDYSEAISMFDLALKYSPNNIKLLANRGVCHMKAEEYDRAIEDYNLAITINPKDKQLYKNLGVIYYTAKNYDEAEKQHIKALEIYEYYDEAYEELGKVYFRQEKFDKAIKHFDIAIKWAEQDTKSFRIWKARCFIGKNNFEEASKIIEEVIQEDSTFAYAYRGKGLMEIKKGNNNEACSYFEKAIELGSELANEDKAEHCK